MSGTAPNMLVYALVAKRKLGIPKFEILAECANSNVEGNFDILAKQVMGTVKHFKEDVASIRCGKHYTFHYRCRLATQQCQIMYLCLSSSECNSQMAFEFLDRLWFQHSSLATYEHLHVAMDTFNATNGTNKNIIDDCFGEGAISYDAELFTEGGASLSEAARARTFSSNQPSQLAQQPSLAPALLEQEIPTGHKLGAVSDDLLSLERPAPAAAMSATPPNATNDAPSQGSMPVAVGLILPMGFMESSSGTPPVADSQLTDSLDGLAKRQLLDSLSSVKTRTDMYNHIFQHAEILTGIPMPRTFSSVSIDQAYKDIKRERLVVNDQEICVQGPEELESALKPHLQQFTFDEDARKRVTLDILQGCSRTASGGDAFFVVASLFQLDGTIVIAGKRDPGPIHLNLCRNGDAVFTTRSNFDLDIIPDHPLSSINTLDTPGVNTFLDDLDNWSFEMVQPVLPGERQATGDPASCGGEGGDPSNAAENSPRDTKLCSLWAQVDERINFIDGTCARTLSISCNAITASNEAYTVARAGISLANGVYKRQLFRNQAPMYQNEHCFTLSMEKVLNKLHWVLGCFPTIYYLCPVVETPNHRRMLNIPIEGWTSVQGVQALPCVLPLAISPAHMPPAAQHPTLKTAIKTSLMVGAAPVSHQRTPDTPMDTGHLMDTCVAKLDAGEVLQAEKPRQPVPEMVTHAEEQRDDVNLIRESLVNTSIAEYPTTAAEIDAATVATAPHEGHDNTTSPGVAVPRPSSINTDDLAMPRTLAPPPTPPRRRRHHQRT